MKLEIVLIVDDLSSAIDTLMKLKKDFPLAILKRIEVSE